MWLYFECCIQFYFPQFKKYVVGSESTVKRSENNQGNEALALQRDPKKAGILQKCGEEKGRKDTTEFTKS